MPREEGFASGAHQGPQQATVSGLEGLIQPGFGSLVLLPFLKPAAGEGLPPPCWPPLFSWLVAKKSSSSTPSCFSP